MKYKWLIIMILGMFVLVGCSGSGGGSEASAQDIPITVTLRKYDPANDPGLYDTELNSTYSYRTIEIDPARTALLLIDVWETSWNDGFDQRMTENKINFLEPLVEKLRQRGVLIIHACYNGDLHGCALPVMEGDVEDTTSDAAMFYDEMASMGIDIVFVAGYASNFCLLHRPLGIDFLMLQPFEQIILVRDCSIAFEMPETLAGEWVHLSIVNMLEIKDIVSTTTLAEID